MRVNDRVTKSCPSSLFDSAIVNTRQQTSCHSLISLTLCLLLESGSKTEERGDNMSQALIFVERSTAGYHYFRSSCLLIFLTQVLSVKRERERDKWSKLKEVEDTHFDEFRDQNPLPSAPRQEIKLTATLCLMLMHWDYKKKRIKDFGMMSCRPLMRASCDLFDSTLHTLPPQSCPLDDKHIRRGTGKKAKVEERTEKNRFATKSLLDRVSTK